jgi:NADP oxidoreductase coenzyme F420-dependent
METEESVALRISTRSLLVIFLLNYAPRSTSNALQATAPYSGIAKTRRWKACTFASSASELQSQPSASEAVSIGFIGCGTIASAIATGLAKQTVVAVDQISVTRRSERKSTALQQAFPTLIHVYDDAQDVVDRSDIVFLTVLPKQTSQVLQALAFDRQRHSLISLVVCGNKAQGRGVCVHCAHAPAEKMLLLVYLLDPDKTIMSLTLI